MIRLAGIKIRLWAQGMAQTAPTAWGLATALVLICLAGPSLATSWSPAMVTQLSAVADMAPAHGLPYERGRLDRLADLQARLELADPRLARTLQYEIDTEASALFRRLAIDFAAGRLAPSTVDRGWHIDPAAPDIEGLETVALELQAVAATLWGLLPAHTEYRALLQAYSEALDPAPLSDDPGSPLVEEEALDDVSREDERVKLRAALERWRWMPRQLPARRLEVRTPTFEISLIANDEVEATYRAVVGKLQTKTPSFQTMVTGVIVNPKWVPPFSIVHNELIPKFRKDPAAVARGGYRLYAPSGERLDPSTIDWSAKPLDIRVVQKSGAGNALGRIKLDMPNRYAIFLHDTPSQSLFGREQRAFSHGCIRVENARDFAVDVLRSKAWQRDKIDEAIAAGGTALLPVPQEIPVFILYMTANLDRDGAITYAQDIYGRDEALVGALEAEDKASGARF